MNIQVNQTVKNGIFKDDIYVTISKDEELENLLYLKFYNNINSITVELLKSMNKEAIRKILLMSHINKIIFVNNQGMKEEFLANKKLIVKFSKNENNNLISDSAIIKFQQILDIKGNLVVVQDIKILTDEILSILEKNDCEYIRVMDFGRGKCTLQQIKNINYKVKEHILTVQKFTTNTEKFTQIYEKLCSEISIDNLDVSYGNIFDIIYGKTTLEGYSNILKYFLDEIGIESKIITGKLSDGTIHSWNQVKIDGIWYNSDLASDVREYKNLNFKEFKYCLKSDEEFYGDHIAISQDIEICNNKSNYIIAKEIENKESFILKLFNKIVSVLHLRKNKKFRTLNSGTEVI